ncbi:unnamed protein product [Lymnaea stagnalis]|uniref:Uncharacterized protein n=1 Tax=Lymnaea stagnalis TaxID=6523 RepID=A0AAV2I9E9_LYMST
MTRDNDARRVMTRDNDARRVMTRDNDARRVMTRDNDARRAMTRDNDSRRVMTRENKAMRIMTRNNDARRVIFRDNDARRVMTRDNESRREMTLDNDARRVMTRDNESRREISQDNDVRRVRTRDNDARRVMTGVYEAPDNPKRSTMVHNTFRIISSDQAGQDARHLTFDLEGKLPLTTKQEYGYLPGSKVLTDHCLDSLDRLDVCKTRGALIHSLPIIDNSANIRRNLKSAEYEWDKDIKAILRAGVIGLVGLSGLFMTSSPFSHKRPVF